MLSWFKMLFHMSNKIVLPAESTATHVTRVPCFLVKWPDVTHCIMLVCKLLATQSAMKLLFIDRQHLQPIKNDTSHKAGRQLQVINLLFEKKHWKLATEYKQQQQRDKLNSPNFTILDSNWTTQQWISITSTTYEAWGLWRTNNKPGAWRVLHQII